MKKSTRRLIKAFRTERQQMTMTRAARARILRKFRAEKGSKYLRDLHLDR